MRKFKNIDEFYQDNPVRRSSGEYDFGCWWRSNSMDKAAVFRLTWVVKTGEFYLWNSATEEVFLLDQNLKTEAEVEVKLLHWAERCGQVNIDYYFPEVTSYNETQT